MEYQNPEKYKSYWKTAVSHIDRNEIYMRGYPLEEISGKVPYTDAIILLLRGELPDEVESKVVNAIFTSAMDHELLNATALAGRVVVSANPDPVVGIAAGILAFGKVTAGVPGYVVEMINEYYPEDESPESMREAAEKLVGDFRSTKRRVCTTRSAPSSCATTSRRLGCGWTARSCSTSSLTPHCSKSSEGRCRST
jgi:citrate synthase